MRNFGEFFEDHGGVFKKFGEKSIDYSGVFGDCGDYGRVFVSYCEVFGNDSGK